MWHADDTSDLYVPLGLFAILKADPLTRATQQMTTLRVFLDQFVDGYLLEDLRSMTEKIGIPHDRQYGAVGYPIVLTSLAGLEVLGALTSTEPFSATDPRKGSEYFQLAWKRWLYPSNVERHAFASPIRSLVRNGIAHLYHTKPGIFIVRGPETEGDHLMFVAGALVIHADLLASHVKVACQRFRTCIESDPAFFTNAASRLVEILDDADEQSRRKLQPIMPQATNMPPAFTNPWSPDSIAPSGMPPRFIGVNSPAPSGSPFVQGSGTGLIQPRPPRRRGP